MKEKFVDFIKENKSLMLGMFLISIHLIYIGIESYQMDFRGAFVAVRSFFDGLAPFSNNVAYGAQYNDGNWSYTFSRFIYPPAALFFYIPFCITKSYFNSKLLMTLFTLITTAGMMLYLKTKHHLKDIFVLLLFFSIATVTNIERGQIYQFIALLLVIAYHNKDKVWAGALIAATAILKIYPGLVLIYFLFRKQYKIFFSSLIFTAIFFIAGIIAFGPESISDFIRNMIHLLYPEFRTPITKAGMDILVHIPNYLSIEQTGNALSYTYNHFTYFHNDIINFLDLWMSDNINIILTAFTIMFAFIFYTRKRKDSPELYYAFMVLPLLVSAVSYIYSLALYTPFAFYALSKNKDKFWLSALILAPLFWPNQYAIEGIYPGLLIACIAIFAVIMQDSETIRNIKLKLKKSEE